MPNALKVSIVVRCLNELANLKNLFVLLKKQTFTNFEIIFVDSGSDDGSLQFVEKLKKDEYLDITILSIKKEDFTFGRSLNIGFKEAKGQIIISLSAHCFPTSNDWIEQYVKDFNRSEKIGIVYGRQIAHENTKFSEESILKKLFLNKSSFQNHSFNNNGNSATLKSLWSLYNFDEDLSGLEDIDYAKFVLKNENEIYYSAEACVKHYHDESYSQIRNRYKREAFALKIIYPKKKKNLFQLFTMFLKDIIYDFKNKKFSNVKNGKNNIDIFRYRFNQFIGTYSGYKKNIYEKYEKKYFYLR